MRIRTRITLQFSIIVSVILISFSAIIYSLVSNFREAEFLERLKDKALTSVKLLSDVDEVNNELLKIIDRNQVNPIPEEKIYIYDIDNRLVYSSLLIDKDEIPHSILNKIKKHREQAFREGKIEGIGILFTGKFDQYIAIATAYDKYGLTKLNYLRNILIIGDIISVLLIIVIGLFFSKQTLNPIANIAQQTDRITASNLNTRIHESENNDELSQLAKSFNKMLERLDAAFEVQRNFVAHASHELRTPLTTLTGELEVSLMNEKIKNSEAEDLLKSMLTEIRELNKLSNGLLDLAQASLDISDIKLTNIRIDELMGISRAEILKRNPEYTVTLNFTDFPEENWLTVFGNEHLLKSCLINVIENACKYSDNKTATVNIAFNATEIILKIEDKGIGIHPEELNQVFEPFYRSKDAKSYKGHGIGLALSKRIITLHKGTIDIQSEYGTGTIVEIIIPHV